MSGLTFELSGRRRVGAWAAKRMMTLAGSRAKCQAGGGPLERRVRAQVSGWRELVNDLVFWPQPDWPVNFDGELSRHLATTMARALGWTLGL